MRLQRNKTNAGLTLVELLSVIGIGALLVTLLLAGAGKALRHARKNVHNAQQRQEVIAAVQAALDEAEAEGRTTHAEQLQALLQVFLTTDMAGWKKWNP